MLKKKPIYIKNKWLQCGAAVFLLLITIWSTINQPKGIPVFSYSLAGKIIVIDPGHGGLDSGASRGDILEKDITLQISKKLGQQLAQAGALVVLLRENESDLAGDEFTGRIRDHKNEDMKKRIERANEAQADLFVSIHANASPSSKWSGAQTFYKPDHEESRKIATAVQNELKKQLKNTRRDIAPGDFFVLNRTQMPAIMVEVGFLSNAAEAQLLIDEEYQHKLIHAVMTGLVVAQQSN